jgi:hypothetical protein
MLYTTRQPTKILTAISLALTVGLLSCQTEGPTEPVVTGIAVAKGGGGRPGPKVDEAVPPITEQSTTLDVHVLGSGYDDGSVATFKINGSEVAQVRTNSTRFVTAEELVANITVDADAPLELYDVEVVTTRGKKGIGADLFKVVKEGSLFDASFRDDPADGMVSDGSGSYDAELDVYFTLDARATNARKLCFDFHGQLEPGQVGFSDQPTAEVLCDDGWLTSGVDNFLEDNQTQGVGLSEMPIGAIQRARLGGFYVREGFNWSFSWGRDCSGDAIPDDRAVITRVSGTVWTIEATTMTLCKAAVRGRKNQDGLVAGGLVMPVKITLTEHFP